MMMTGGELQVFSYGFVFVKAQRKEVASVRDEYIEIHLVPKRGLDIFR